MPAPSPDLHALGRAVRRARVDRDLSQEALAERAGMNAKYLSELERGRKDARTSTILRLVDAMDMRAGDLYALYDRAHAGDDLTPPRIRAPRRQAR